MNATSPTSITPDYLFHNVLSGFPVMNKQTTYTAIMSPADGLYYAVARNVAA